MRKESPHVLEQTQIKRLHLETVLKLGIESISVEKGQTTDRPQNHVLFLIGLEVAPTLSRRRLMLTKKGRGKYH